MPKSIEEQHSMVISCMMHRINTFVFAVDFPLTLAPSRRIIPPFPPAPSSDLKSFQRFKLEIGASLFFTLVKMFMLYLLMRFLISDCYNIITSYNGTYCGNLLTDKTISKSDYCAEDFRAYLSSYNKHTQNQVYSFEMLDHLDILLTFFSMIFFLYCREQIYKIHNLIEFEVVRPETYTVLVQDIPLLLYKSDNSINFDFQREIRDSLNHSINKWKREAIQRCKKQENRQNHIDMTDIDIVQRDFYRKFKHNPLINDTENIHSVTLCFDSNSLEYLDQIRSKLINEHYQSNAYGSDDFNLTNRVQEVLANEIMNTEMRHVYGPYQIRQINQIYSRKLCQYLMYFRHMKQRSTYQGLKKYLQNQPNLTFQNQPSFSQISYNQAHGQQQQRQDAFYHPDRACKQFVIMHFLGKAFVTFKTEHYKSYCLLKAQEDIQSFQICSRVVKLEETFKPANIKWKNLRYTDEERAKNKIHSVASLYSVFLVSLLVLFGINYLSQNKDSLQLKTQQTGTAGFVLNNIWGAISSGFFAILLPFLTNSINSIIHQLIQRYILWEKQKTLEYEKFNYILRSIIFQFFNNTIIYLILALVNSELNPLSKNGFIISTTNLIGVTMIMKFFMAKVKSLLSQKFGLGSLLSAFTPQKQHKNHPNAIHYQHQLNQNAEYSQFKYADKYINYISQIFLVTFFASVIPIGSIILFLVFWINYFSDKDQHFGKSSTGYFFNLYLIKHVWFIFQFVILISAAGSFIFDYFLSKQFELSHQYLVLNLVNLGMAATYLTIMFFKSQFMFSTEKVYTSQIYGQRNNNLKTYESQNYIAKYISGSKRFQVIKTHNSKDLIDQSLKKTQIQQASQNNYKQRYNKYYQQHHNFYDIV